MGEFFILAKGRKFYPASLNQVDVEINSNAYGFYILEGVKIPLFPGPSLEDCVEMEKHHDMAHFNRVKEEEMKKISKKFEANVDVSKLAEFKNRFEILYSILFEALPYFVSTPRVSTDEIKGLTLKESQVIRLLLDNVNIERYKKYESQVRSIINIEDVENIDKYLDELREKKDPWRIFQEYLRGGISFKTSQVTSEITEEQKLAKILKQLQFNTPEIKGPAKDSQYFNLGEIPPNIFGEYFLIDDEKIFRLRECAEESANEIIEIDGKNFCRGQSFDKLILNCALEESLRRKALEENRDRVVESLKKIKEEIRAKVEADSLALSSLLLMFSEMDSFELGKFGFLRNPERAESYTVYVHTGEYVLKDWKDYRHKLYKFPSCRVGVTVTPHEVSAPFVLDPYKHPSLEGDMVSGQRICLAGAPLPGRTLGEKICERIELAINVMLGGYTPDCRPNRQLSDPIFDDYEISPNDRGLRSGKYFITNEFRGR